MGVGAHSRWAQGGSSEHPGVWTAGVLTASTLAAPEGCLALTAHLNLVNAPVPSQLSIPSFPPTHGPSPRHRRHDSLHKLINLLGSIQLTQALSQRHPSRLSRREALRLTPVHTWDTGETFSLPRQLRGGAGLSLTPMGACPLLDTC